METSNDEFSVNVARQPSYPLVLPMALRRALIIFLWTAAVASSGCSNNTAAAGPGSGGGGGRGRGGRGGGGDAPVVTSKVGERDVPIELAAIGNVEAFVTNSVRAQVTRTLVDEAFDECEDANEVQKLCKLH